MSEEAAKPESKPKAAAPAEPPPPLRPRDLWPIPVAVLALALAAGGLVTLARKTPGPDNKGVMADAATLIERQQYGPALDVLNGPITGTIGAEGVDPALRAEYHALRGEALHLAHLQREPDHESEAARTNFSRALAEFQKARALDPASITPRRRGFIADIQIDLGQLEEAEKETFMLGDAEGERRRRLIRKMIDRVLEGPPAFHGRAYTLMERLRNDPGVPEEDRAWVVAKRASAMLDDDNAQPAIDLLLPEVQRLTELESLAAGELLLLLGRAYIEAGQLEPAAAQLAQAERGFLPGDDHRGVIDALLARISQSRGELEEARDRFATVVERYPGADAQALGLLGLAESEADLGRHHEALTAYGKLVQMLKGGVSPLGVSRAAAEASLAARHAARISAGDPETALLYATLESRVDPAGEPTAEALDRLATTHRELASELLGGLSDDPALAGRLVGVPAETIERARVHFVEAGTAFEKYGRKVVVDDPNAASISLWNAADCFDRAGDQTRAIQLFTEFVQTHKNSDRLLEGKFRLARCFQAQNQYDTAVNLFEAIIQANPGSDEAYRAYVPLAQCYLLRSGDADADRAQQLLNSVLDGRVFRPDAPDFKRALIELGKLHLRQGHASEAIERLREAIDRYPDAPERARLDFDLADALRLSASAIEKQLGDAMPVADRSRLAELRRQRLGEARDLYEQVRARIEAADPATLTEIQRLVLRNAIFYRADCAFDLGDYETAIRHYDAAAQRYADDPASLVAMVQIVNCYTALGKLREARTAHSRAQMRLRELPDSAWQGAMTPMDRKHWERWLESSLRLERADRQRQASATPATN